MNPVRSGSDQLEQGTSLWKDAWYRLRKNRVALFGLFTFSVITILCLVGPFFTGYTYEQTEISLKASAPMEPIFLRSEALKTGEFRKSLVALSNLEDEFLDRPTSDRQQIAGKIAREGTYREGQITYEPSKRRHLFGTDPLGRDLLTRVLIGGRISLAVGFAATLVSVCIGVLWGAVAGYLGGNTDTVMMRFADILYALPFTVIVILLMVMFGRNFILLFVAIGAVEWLTMARIVRGQIISLEKSGIYRSSHLAGASWSSDLVSSSAPKRLGTDHHLRHAHFSGSDAFGSGLKFSRSGSTTSSQFVGRVDR